MSYDFAAPEKVGGLCATPADCMGIATCSMSSSNSVCQCETGVANSDGTSCSLVRLEQPCGRNEDCGGGGGCLTRDKQIFYYIVQVTLLFCAVCDTVVGAQCNSTSICVCPPNLQSSDGVSCTACK